MIKQSFRTQLRIIWPSGSTCPHWARQLCISLNCLCGLLPATQLFKPKLNLIENVSCQETQEVGEWGSISLAERDYKHIFPKCATKVVHVLFSFKLPTSPCLPDPSLCSLPGLWTSNSKMYIFPQVCGAIYPSDCFVLRCSVFTISAV